MTTRAITILQFVSICLLSSTLQAAEGITVEGFSQPNRLSRVAAPISGILDERTTPCGTFVSEGECVAQLDRRLFENSFEVARLRKEASAGLKSAQADISFAKKRLEVLRELAQQDHASSDEIMRAESELQRAEAKLRAANEEKQLRAAEFQQLMVQAEAYRIKAPFSGVITEYTKQRGEWVGPSDPHVCTIAQLDVLTVDFLVPSNGRDGLQVGQQIEVKFVDSQQTTTGEIYFISPFANAETNTFELHVRVANPDQRFAAGKRCQILIN